MEVRDGIRGGWVQQTLNIETSMGKGHGYESRNHNTRNQDSETEYGHEYGEGYRDGTRRRALSHNHKLIQVAKGRF